MSVLDNYGTSAVPWSSKIGYECTAILAITVWLAVVPLLMEVCLLSPIWNSGNGTDLMYPLERH